jgi:hypothetical protein
MFRPRRLRSGTLLMAIASLTAWTVTAQQPRRVVDALLKTGS